VLGTPDGGAFDGAANLLVARDSGSLSESEPASVSDLTFGAVATPLATNQLYPGGTSDVALTITNSNPYSVTVTGVYLPGDTTSANGCTSSALTSAHDGCFTTTSSHVTWNFATAASGGRHTFTTAITIGPLGEVNSPLTVTLINDASMEGGASTACEATFFMVPPLAGIAATRGVAPITLTPVVDEWTQKGRTT
jgi:hypothetical protein